MTREAEYDKTKRLIQDTLMPRIAELEAEVAHWRQANDDNVAHSVHNPGSRVRCSEYDRAEKAEARVAELEQHILDIDAHATPYGDIPEEPGWIGTYLVTAGALHRALGKIGHSVPSCQAEAQLQAHRTFVAAFDKWTSAGLFGAIVNGHSEWWQDLIRARDVLKALDQADPAPPDDDGSVMMRLDYAPEDGVYDETPEVRAIHNTP